MSNRTRYPFWTDRVIIKLTQSSRAGARTELGKNVGSYMWDHFKHLSLRDISIKANHTGYAVKTILTAIVSCFFHIRGYPSLEARPLNI